MDQQMKRRGGSPRCAKRGEAWSSTSQTSFSANNHEDARSPARRKMRSLSSNVETDNGFLGRAYENASHVDIEDDLIVIQA